MYAVNISFHRAFLNLGPGAELASLPRRRTSLTTIPRIQQLIRKKIMLASQSPGTNVERPKNSSSYPC